MSSNTRPATAGIDVHAATSVAKQGRPPGSKGLSGSRAENRIQVKLTDQGKDRLDELVSRVGAETTAHVVRDALRIYDILTEEAFVHKNKVLIKDGQTNEIMQLRLW